MFEQTPRYESSAKRGHGQKPLRILVHDFAGYPYAVQLSRSLALRGHQILHVYSASVPTPQGGVERRGDDPPTFHIKEIQLSRRIEKGKLALRRRLEIEHGKKVGEEIRRFQPDFVLSGNSPLDSQNQIWRVCHSLGVPAVFWLQDLIGVATHAILKNKLPVVGAAIGRHYMNMEKRLLRRSAAVVAITQDFSELLERLGVRPDGVHIIENWAPLAEVPMMEKSNEWSIRHGLDRSFNLLYCGTLGMKHNPDMLVKLAQAFTKETEVKVVVATEGIGRSVLETRKSQLQLDNLVLLDFQHFSEVPSMMGAAEACLVLLEPSAGVFSVPSKTLSCLCSGRPVLMAVPENNLAAKIVRGADAGLLCSPDDDVQFVEHARELFENESLRRRLGQNGRQFAERAFDIELVADRFESLFGANGESGLSAARGRLTLKAQA